MQSCGGHNFHAGGMGRVVKQAEAQLAWLVA